jgi:hypothetical protein
MVIHMFLSFVFFVCVSTGSVAYSCPSVTNNIPETNNCGIKYMSRSKDKTIQDTITNELNKYDQTILEKIAQYIIIVPAIIVMSDETICGGVCTSDKTLYVSTEESCTPEETVHHELFHLFDYLMLGDDYSTDKEWANLNKNNKYVADYKNQLVKKGFINSHGMQNILEDKATVFEEFMITKNNEATYDEIIIEKFKLMFKRLVVFDAGFEKLIKKRNDEMNYIFPHYLDNNYIKKYVLNKVEYTGDEDNFVLNFKPDLANQAETEKYNKLIQKYSKSAFPGTNYQFIKIEPLIFVKDMQNRIGHLYGMFEIGQKYKIPDYIGSKISRVISHYGHWMSQLTKLLDIYVLLKNNEITLSNFNADITKFFFSALGKYYVHVDFSFDL